MISIVIPHRGTTQCLIKSLEAIARQTVKPKEVIIVHDSLEKLKVELRKYEFSLKVVELGAHFGVSAARNRGLAEVTSEYVLFLDSDILLNPLSLELSLKLIKRYDILTSFPDLETHFDNFASKYQNTYLFWLFSKFDNAFIDFAYGGFILTSKADCLKFNPDFIAAEDSEWGKRSIESGKKIHLNSSIKISHYKKYKILSLLLYYFKISRGFAKLLLNSNKKENKYKSHIQTHQMFSMIATLFWLVYFIINWKIACFLILFVIYLNLKRLNFYRLVHGNAFFFKAILMIICENVFRIFGASSVLLFK
ncbi:MAG: hypothetical protein Fur0010_00880 [Bdellovibrio sp.]